MRYTCGTGRAEAGTPIEIIAELTGHSTTRVTVQHMHVAQKQGHRYIEKAFESFILL